MVQSPTKICEIIDIKINKQKKRVIFLFLKIILTQAERKELSIMQKHMDNFQQTDSSKRYSKQSES